MRTLDIEYKHRGRWHALGGHGCESDRQVLAYIARFGMPRPPKRFATLPGLVVRIRIPPKEADAMFATAIKRWRKEWAKGPTMRAVPALNGKDLVR